MHANKIARGFLVVLLAAALASCGGGLTTPPPPVQASKVGTSFIVGQDAPLGSVLAFKVTLTGLSASDGTNTVSLITQSQDVEFARLNGLRTLLDIRSVPAGSYTSVTATISAPVISYLDTSTTPPSVQTMNGTLTQSSITVQLRQPMVVTDNGLVGLHMDFRLGSSIQTDANGQITGTVDPKIAFHAIPPDAPEAEIDELHGGVVSVNAAGGSFVMQGPHGRLLTVTTDNNTLFAPGESLNTFDTNTIVEVSGKLQRQTLTLLASSVQVVSNDRFLLGGLITDVRPASGPANQMDLLVHAELPDLANAQIGRITSLDFDGNERFVIHHFMLPVGFFLFNRAGLMPGQRVSTGGLLVTSTNPPGLDVRRVTLHRQGVAGDWVVGSTNIVNGNNGSFRLNAHGLTGILFGTSAKVATSDRTRFINLPGGLADLSGTSTMPIRVVGLVLQDPVNGKPIIIAWAVEKLMPLVP
ncbi:MAG: hypothetical protein HY234_04285 [Acidobacteria bacterium]|nr:hypothetical protein [Acidobacteriota bacterium]MBI3662255.1 hypothetical protein [Acidobacteriota bacterium]